MNILQVLQEHTPKSSNHELPIIWHDGIDSVIWDIDGKEYIDFSSGIFVTNIGHGNIQVIDAINRQMEEGIFFSYAFPTEIKARLVQKLVDMTGFQKVFLCSTGSEAVEAAIRCMNSKFPKSKHSIDGLMGAFHGNTAGAKGIVKYLAKPVTLDEVGFLPTGLVIESYLGYGAIFHDKEWIQSLCLSAKRHGVPVCFDEVQAGFGRTGKLFGYEHYGVKPDLICVGKALGNGIPIAAVLGSAELLDAPDDLSSTFGGNPLSCAAALATLEYLESNKLVERVQALESFFRDCLQSNCENYPITGKGFIWAIHIGDKDLTDRILQRCAEKGLLMVRTQKGTLKLGPPLTMPEEMIREGCSIIEEAIKECCSGM